MNGVSRCGGVDVWRKRCQQLRRTRYIGCTIHIATIVTRIGIRSWPTSLSVTLSRIFLKNLTAVLLRITYSVHYRRHARQVFIGPLSRKIKTIVPEFKTLGGYASLTLGYLLNRPSAL